MHRLFQSSIYLREIISFYENNHHMNIAETEFYKIKKEKITRLQV